MIRIYFLVLFSIFHHSQQSCSGLKDEPQPPPPYVLGSIHLTELALVETEIYEEMLIYVKALEERVALIDAYINDYQDSTLKLTLNSNMDWEQAEKIASHPIAAFRMIRRLSQDFNSIWDNIDENHEQRLEENIKNISAGLLLPTGTDHYDAIEAMLMIHYFYDLNLEEFGNGNIMGVQTDAELPPSQMLQIAKYATSNNYYTLAMDWLQAAESKAAKQNDLFLTLELWDLRKTIIENHDANFEQNLEHNPLNFFSEKLRENQNPSKILSIDYKEWKESNKTDDGRTKHYTFIALCNGESFQSEKLKASLYCYYDKSHPYFYLFPLKAERLSHEPLLVQYHQLISEEWTNSFKAAAIPYLQGAPPPVVTSEDAAKTSIYVWVKDEAIENADISRRIELMTGLNVRSENASGFLQIATYSYGGFVDPHYDSYGGHDADNYQFRVKGNRASTFLAYLNDVERGGFTAFPLLGIHVKPEKGSAIVWYTALKNGNVDMRTYHGACPVVLGHKWIASKWTHLKENFLTRPCALDASI